MAKRKSVSKSSVELPPVYPEPSMTPKRMSPWKIVVGALIVLAIVLLAMNKGWVVAAVVNGKPIFSWELNRALQSRFGQQTLEGMIGEVLIAEQAKSAGVSVSDEEVEAKQNEVLASLGPDVKLEDLLKFQGLTEEDFINQLKLQLLVEKLLTRDLNITENDINNYIASNRATLTATEPAALKMEAEQVIKSNTVNEKLQEWFAQIRQNAKVMKFL